MGPDFPTGRGRWTAAMGIALASALVCSSNAASATPASSTPPSSPVWEAVRAQVGQVAEQCSRWGMDPAFDATRVVTYQEATRLYTAVGRSLVGADWRMNIPGGARKLSGPGNYPRLPSPLSDWTAGFSAGRPATFGQSSHTLVLWISAAPVRSACIEPSVTLRLYPGITAQTPIGAPRGELFIHDGSIEVTLESSDSAELERISRLATAVGISALRRTAGASRTPSYAFACPDREAWSAATGGASDTEVWTSQSEGDARPSESAAIALPWNGYLAAHLVRRLIRIESIGPARVRVVSGSRPTRVLSDGDDIEGGRADLVNAVWEPGHDILARDATTGACIRMWVRGGQTTDPRSGGLLVTPGVDVPANLRAGEAMVLFGSDDSGTYDLMVRILPTEELITHFSSPSEVVAEPNHFLDEVIEPVPLNA